ncbi:alanine racemase [Patescibacteria group bacterium]|nr:alanine racemase [Patescibacteria group bacterium]
MEASTNIKAKTWVEISENNIKHNIKVFQELVKSESEIMAVVKSNAYGHGLLEMAKIIKNFGLKYFAVDSLNEALELRKFGIKETILILGFTRPDNVKLAIENDISFVIYDDKVMDVLLNLSQEGLLKDHPAKVHLKVETGTVRQGLKGIDLQKFALKLKEIKGVLFEGVYTHYANVEDALNQDFANNQLANFNQEVLNLEKLGISFKIKHTACSAAALLLPQARFDLIRLGISMYGFWSSLDTEKISKLKYANVELKPALCWKTVIAQIKDVPSGTSVSYGLTEKVTRQGKIAVLPIGYWDGYDRGLSSMGTVLVHGVRCKIIGRICMNMCMVDVTDVEQVNVEDEVVLLGKQNEDQISAEEIADKIGTINYEVVTRINPLIPRIVV